MLLLLQRFILEKWKRCKWGMALWIVLEVLQRQIMTRYNERNTIWITVCVTESTADLTTCSRLPYTITRSQLSSSADTPTTWHRSAQRRDCGRWAGASTFPAAAPQTTPCHNVLYTFKVIPQHIINRWRKIKEDFLLLEYNLNSYFNTQNWSCDSKAADR